MKRDERFILFRIIPHSSFIATMAREYIIVGIDVGTTTIHTVVAHKEMGGAGSLQIIGVGSVPAMGMRKGRVVDVQDVAKSIQQSVVEAERMSGAKIGQAYVGINGNHITSFPGKGVVAVSRADQQIFDDDIQRVLAAAQTISLPPNREILHVFPREYIVDGEGGIRDATGMTGVRLEVNTLIIGGFSPVMKSLRQAVEGAGVEVSSFVINPYAASKAVLTKRQRELGTACVDIGGGTTSLIVFEEGNILHTAVFPLGSMHITNDIAIGLRTSVDCAERLKREYGVASAREVAKRDTIDLAKIDPNEEGIVLRKDLAEIMEARLSEIFDLVNKELRTIGREAFLPGGIVLVGGGSKVPHILDLAKDRMRLPVQIGFPKEAEGVIDLVDDPAYATAAGLIFWGLEQEEKGEKKQNVFSPLNDMKGKATKWLRAFMP